MKTCVYVVVCVLLWATISAPAATVIWPQQDAKTWNAVDAIWELSLGTPSPVPPGIGDYAYMLSTNEITVNSIVPTIKRLFIDRAVTGYTTVASTVTIVPGGQLTVDSFCQIGYSIDGGTVNVAGGHFIIAATDRSGTYSLVMDDNYAGIINVTAGALSIRNGSQFDFQAGSQGVVTVSGTGLIEFLDGSMMDMGAGALGVTISDTGLIKFVGRNATGEVQTIANNGQLTGIAPVSPPLYSPQGTANGVGWYYDGSDTYVFTAAGPDIEIGNDRVVLLADAAAGIQMDGQILNFDPGDIYAYAWSGAGVTFSPNATVEDPVATFGGAGTYTVTLQVTNSIGIGADSIAVTVIDPAVENKQIAHWALNDGGGTTVSDTSVDGYTNTGTINGTVDWRDGWVGTNSLYFNGSTTVDVVTDLPPGDPNGLSLDKIQYGITLSAWVKADLEGIQTKYVLEKPGCFDLRLMPSGGGFRARLNGLSDQYLDSENGVLLQRFDDGNWYHVAATYSAVEQEANLYVNGLLVRTMPTSGLLNTSPDSLILGDDLVGGLDDIYIYSYALTESEVQALAALGEKTPLVYAGADQAYQINPSFPLVLDSFVHDLDSSPALLWSVSPDSVGSASSVSFVDASDPTTEINFEPSDPDTFILRLTATDMINGQPVEVYDEVEIITNSPTCADVINAGLTLPLDVSGPIEGQPDCYINLYDLAYFAQSWLDCNDPVNAGCDWPWQ